MQQQLTEAGIGPARAESRQIVAHALGVSLGDLRLAELTGRLRVNAERLHTIETLTERRSHRIPLQHVLGSAPFRALDLAVGPGVFVPRPETELLVERALELLTERRAAGQTPVSAPDGSAAAVAARLGTAPRLLQVFEAGTGSAAISLAIATEMPRTRVRTVELEPAAQAWAQRNIDAQADGLAAVESAVALVAGDAIADLATASSSPSSARSQTRSTVHLAPGRPAAEPVGAFDLIVSNPPYVPTGDVPLEPEARADPASALYSGADGLDFIRALISPAFAALQGGGGILLEHTEQQGADVRTLLEGVGFEAAQTHRDLTGRDRFTEARRPLRR
nr:HemK/PrmC family methyltransferase [Pseudoclavibacter sp. 13-3]